MACNVAVLVSGSGTNLQAILDTERAGKLGGATVRLVIANKAKAYGLERARIAGVRAEHVSVKTEGSPIALANKMLELFSKEAVELIVLAGYLKLVHPNVVKKFHRRIINIHPALLPKFGGEGMYGMKVHEAVLAAREKYSGPSVHFVDEIFDNGPVIAQEKVPVREDDTPESLQARVLAVEHRILPETIRKLATGEIRLGE